MCDTHVTPMLQQFDTCITHMKPLCDTFKYRQIFTSMTPIIWHLCDTRMITMSHLCDKKWEPLSHKYATCDQCDTYATLMCYLCDNYVWPTLVPIVAVRVLTADRLWVSGYCPNLLKYYYLLNKIKIYVFETFNAKFSEIKITNVNMIILSTKL